MIENQSFKEPKVKNKKIFIVFVVLSLFLVLSLVLYLVFKRSILSTPLSSTYFPPGENTVTETLEAEESSPFSSFVDGGSDDKINESQEGVLVSTSLGEASKFVLLNMVARESDRPVVTDSQIVLEVVGDNSNKAYKVLKSDNPSYNHSVGEVADFEFTVDSENLIVKSCVTLYSFQEYSSEYPDYVFPESLVVGNKVVFKCRLSDCSDGVLSWALIFNEY